MRPRGAWGAWLLLCWQLRAVSSLRGCGSVAAPSGQGLHEPAVTDEDCFPSGSVAFRHGVASGDPLPDAIIIWTRATPIQAQPEAIPLKWMVWDAHGTLAANGTVKAVRERDYTVKVDVSGLRPGVRYSYKFFISYMVSPVGSFRLPPAKNETLKDLSYAVFSCSNWRWGLFNAYGAAAKKPLDFWLHLGDFIYESGKDLYPNDEQAVRDFLDPPHELLSLDDYRRRYRLHRSDKQLQELSLAAPVIAIWDDHEVTNDVYKTGGKNHQSETEGDYKARKMAALRAYHEWMPTRLDLTDLPLAGSPALWQSRRSFEFGDLASLVVLETRHTARSWQGLITRQTVTEQIESVLSGAGYPPPDHLAGTSIESMLLAIRSEVEASRRVATKHMIGPVQHAWVSYLADNATADNISWFLVAQPLVMQDLMPADHLRALRLAEQKGSPDAPRWRETLSKATGLKIDDNVTAVHLHGQGGTSASEINAQVSLIAGKYGITMDFDSWSGYVAARERLLDAISGAGPGRAIVYGGDSHNAWAGVVRNASSHPVLTEFDGFSVSSPGMEYYRTWSSPDLEAAAWLAANDGLQWVDTHRRGFMYVHLNSTVQHLEYHTVNTSRSSTAASSRCLAAFDVKCGTVGMARVACNSA